MLVFSSKATSKTCTVKSFITCRTTHVVYLVQCLCGLQYVGPTTRTLNVRLNEHIANIRKGYKNHSVSRHYNLVHNRDPTGTLFMGIESFTSNWRGSFKVRELSKIETKWIYLLKSYVPHGLNVDWDVNSFLDNSWTCFFKHFNNKCKTF